MAVNNMSPRDLTSLQIRLEIAAYRHARSFLEELRAWKTPIPGRPPCFCGTWKGVVTLTAGEEVRGVDAAAFCLERLGLTKSMEDFLRGQGWLELEGDEASSEHS